MEDLFKKFINTGVGFLSQGNKRIQAAIDQLVKDSKMSEQEGKKIMDDLLKSGDAKRKSLEKQFQGLTDSVRERVGLAAEPAHKAAPAKAKPAAKKAGSATSKVASATKKAADTVSTAADKAKRSAAAKAGAAKKKAAAETK